MFGGDHRVELWLALEHFCIEVEQLLCLLQLADILDFPAPAYAFQSLCLELVPDGTAIFVLSVFDSQGNDLVNKLVEFQSAISAHT